MTVENITRRYNFTYAELEKFLEIKGKIERIEDVGQYQKDNDVDLKEVDAIITTLEEIKPDEDKEKKTNS